MAWDSNSEMLLKDLIANKKLTGNFATVYRLLRKFNLPHKNSRLLSIGAGNGSIELELMNQFDLEIGYVDPSSTLADIFYKQIHDSKQNDKLLDYHVGPFETFKTNNQYDLIISIHSWYYINTDKKSFDHLLSLLKASGKALILLTTKNDFTKLLIKEFASGNLVLNAEEFADSLLQNNMIFNSDSINEAVDYDKSIDSKGFTEFGKKWVSYFLRQNFEDLELNTQVQLFNFFKLHKAKKTSFSYTAFWLEEKV